MGNAIFLYISSLLMAASGAALIWLARQMLRRFFSRWLEQSGQADKAAQTELALISLSASAGVLLVLSLIGVPLFFGLPMVGVLALVLPGLLSRRRHQLYLKAFEASLAESLTTIGASIKAGLTLKDSLLVASNNCPPAFARETATVLKEYRFGKPIDEALDGVRQRIKTDNANIAFGAMIIASRLGGNLTQILQRIAKTVRDRDRVEGKLQALTAQGRAQAFILCSAPPGIGFLMYLVDPSKMNIFLNTFSGQLLLTAAILLEVIGIAVTRRVMRIVI